MPGAAVKRATAASVIKTNGAEPRKIAVSGISGATLCIYDVMKGGAGEIAYPVPWAESPETSHLTTADEMRGLLDGAGFELREVEDRSVFARAHFQRTLAAADASEGGPPPLGTHLILGASAPVKFRNMLANIEAGHIASTQMIATRRAT